MLVKGITFGVGFGFFGDPLIWRGLDWLNTNFLSGKNCSNYETRSSRASLLMHSLPLLYYALAKQTKHLFHHHRTLAWRPLTMSPST